MINIGKYRVHRVGDVPQVVPVLFEGNVVHATVPGLEVELTGVDDMNGTLTLRFAGAAVEDAKEQFPVDGEGDLSWELATVPAEDNE